MPAKPLLNRPHGLIESPGIYLQYCTGREYRREARFFTESDFALRQYEYEDCGGGPCPNCTPAALVNALGAYRSRYPQIPGDPQECYALLRRHMRLFRSPLPRLGGYPSFLNALLVRRLWRLLGIDAWPAVYLFPDRRTLRRLAEGGSPLVLSLRSKVYGGHTVLLLGWEVWTDGKRPRLFWIVRDGWRREARYLDAEAGWISQAIQMAGPSAPG